MNDTNRYYNIHLKHENKHWEYIVFYYLKELMEKNDFDEMKQIIDFYNFDITFTRDKNYSLLWYASEKLNKEWFSFLMENIVNKKESKEQIDTILDALFDFDTKDVNHINIVYYDDYIIDHIDNDQMSTLTQEQEPTLDENTYCCCCSIR